MRTQVHHNKRDQRYELFTMISECEMVQHKTAVSIFDAAINQAGKEMARLMVRNLRSNLGVRRIKPIGR